MMIDNIERIATMGMTCGRLATGPLDFCIERAE